MRLNVGNLLAGSVPPPVRYLEGMHVRILQGESYRGAYADRTGVIVREPTYSSACACANENKESSVGVLLDDKWNESSKYGCYWFKLHEVQIITINQEDNNMLLLKGYRVARVDIHGLGMLNVAFYGDLQIGDYVVVAAYECYYCGRVDDVYMDCEIPQQVPKYQAVCTFDPSAHLDRVARAQRAKDIESKLKSAAKDFQQMAFYEVMAEKCPEIKALLDELKELTSG